MEGLDPGADYVATVVAYTTALKTQDVRTIAAARRCATPRAG